MRLRICLTILLFSTIVEGQAVFNWRLLSPTGGVTSSGASAFSNVSSAGSSFPSLSWTLAAGTLTTCTIQVDFSTDGVTVAGQAVPSQTCTASGSVIITTAATYSFVRVSYIIGSGGGTITYVAQGCKNNTCTSGGGGGGGSGTVGSGTINQFAVYTGATTVGSSAHLDDGLTTAGFITSASNLKVNGLINVQGAFQADSPVPTAIMPVSTNGSSFGISNDGNFYISANKAAINEVCTSGNGACAAIGGVVTYTTSVTAALSDSGKLVIMNCTASCSYTLPSVQPSLIFNVQLMSIGTALASIGLSGTTFNGIATVPLLQTYVQQPIYANPTLIHDYDGAPTIGTPIGIITYTPASSNTGYVLGSNLNLPPSSTLVMVNTSSSPSTGAFPFTSASSLAISTPLDCADASGSTTTYTCTTAPSFTAGAQTYVLFTPQTTNTGASTLSVNGGTAYGIRKWSCTQALAAGDLVGTITYVLPLSNGGGTPCWSLSDIGNAPGGVTGTGTTNSITKWTGTTSIGNATSTDIVNNFTGCSGTLYLGADGACHSAGGGGALSAITAALATNTIANGNFAQVWNWAQTSASQAAMTLGETTASSGSGDIILNLPTLSGSTATNLNMTQPGITGTVSVPAMNVTTTLNNSSLTDNVFGITITNTASAGTGSTFFNFLAGATGTSLESKLDIGGNFYVAGVITGTGASSNAELCGGNIASCTSGANQQVGGVLLQGSDDNNSGASVKAGYGLFRGGMLSNAVPSATALEGTTQVAAGFIKSAGAIAAVGDIVTGITANYNVQDCAISCNNAVGIATSITTPISVVMYGTAPVSLDNTATIGDVVCISSTTAGKGHDNGTTACTAGQGVGVVIATSGAPLMFTGTSETAVTLSTALPLVVLHFK